ncbi:sugar transferase [Patescibacteria group bacterium]|nr:sugar transferase [Patescibacteria group bacterium]
MKNNSSLVYNVFLIVGDFLALVGAFSLAYIFRVSVSHARISTPITARTYLETFLVLLPFFILFFALIGLYTREIYEQRFKEIGRLAVGVFIGVLFIISFGYVFNVKIFPARLVILYGYFLALLLILGFRNATRFGRRILFRYGKGINNVLIVGDTELSRELINLLTPSEISGYRVIGVVGGVKHPLRSTAPYALFANFNQAVKKIGNRLHTIIQTELYSDESKNSLILTYAQQHHVAYRFVPGNGELFVGNIGVEVFRGVPVIEVHQTALIGWGQIVKRALDIVLGTIMLIIASPFMLLIAIAIKVFDSGPVFFRQVRLTRYDQKFKVYKFRTNKIEFNGLTPEEAFAKLGRPDLAKTYRKNGDFLPNDPRISAIGRFLRKFSLDELPQLINVVKGDLSLVGPRALIPQELELYTKRYAILSVRSGLTGLAVVSGRRNISFDERRQLDLYYVQNWSLWNDLVILIKTVWIVLRHKGAV